MDPEPQAGPARDGRDETELERADRNMSELLGELRVLTTGCQFLFGFLLTVPFTQRFSHVSAGERYLYLTVLLLAAAAAGMLIAPTAMHRLLFRQGDKRHLVSVASRLAIGGIACLTVAMTGILTLITGYLFGWVAGGVVATLAFTYFVTLWFALGIRRRIVVRRTAAGQ